MFTLRQLEYFVAIAETGSITHAAAELNASESAVANALSHLEKRLGTLTVRRRAHGVTLTPAGHAAHIRARALLRDAQEFALEYDTHSPHTTLRGPLHIDCYPTLAPGLLPDLIENFSHLHPEVDINFTESSQTQLTTRVASGETDLGILYDRDLTAAIHTQELFRTRAYALLPSSHALAAHETVTLADLATEPFIKYDVSPAWQHTLQLFTAQGVHPQVRHTTSNFELARALVGRGLGYSVLVNRPNTSLTHEGLEVVMRELSPEVPPVAVVLGWSRTVPLSVRGRAFAEFAVARVRNKKIPASAHSSVSADGS